MLGFLAVCGSVVTFFFAKSLHETKAIINTSIESIKNKAELEFSNTVKSKMEGFNKSLEENQAFAQAAVKALEAEYTADRRSVIWLCSIIARAYVVLSHSPMENPKRKLL